MKRFIEQLNERICILEEIIRLKEAEIEGAPEGIINIMHSKNRVQYYYKNNSSDSVRKYMKNTDEKLVRDLCQRDYDEKVLLMSKKELHQLKKVCKYLQKGSWEDIYEQLGKYRKEMVRPIILPDDEYIANWEEKQYIGKEFVEDAPEFYTDKGERVRSKSEIIIANTLKRHNIPYKYECPLYLKGYGMVYPDFTVLNVRLRKEFYWEHMGMLEDPDYLEKALKKIDTYQKNNIFPGKQLILSHETQKAPLNTRNIENMIMNHLV